MPYEWKISSVDQALERLFVSKLGISPITARVLAGRGIKSLEEANKYFEPTLGDIPDPFGLSNMQTAVDRVSRAIQSNEKMAIYGDYDVDGITGTSLLVRFFDSLGVKAISALPSRREEGYGLTASAVDALHAKGAKLIITVDNGSRAVDAIRHANELGVDVIVTDHHGIDDNESGAIAIVNPKLDDSDGPFIDLSGCGVAFMFALALRKHLRDIGYKMSPEPNLREHLDLVALGTIADVMPLTGVNRVLVQFGMVQIVKSAKAGVKALLDVSRTPLETFGPDSVAFHLAPRLNAAGRMGDPDMALHLLLVDDASFCADVAIRLDQANRSRQDEEARIIDEAEAFLAGNPDVLTHAGLVLASKGWHVGVVGIAASKLAQKLMRPVAVLSLDCEPARGSVRGVDGLNLVSALDLCKKHLVRFGGHKMAAGLSVARDNVVSFARAFHEACKTLLPEGYTKYLTIDARVSGKDVTENLVEELMRCRPFGAGNAEPLLLIEDCEIQERRIVGTKHLKLKLKTNGLTFNCIGFGMMDKLDNAATKVSIVFVPEFNIWNGVRSVQLRLKDIKGSF